MSLSKRKLAQIAQDIRAQLKVLKSNRPKEVRTKLTALLDQLHGLQALDRKLGLCDAHEWDAAAAKLMDAAEWVFRDLASRIDAVVRAIATCDNDVPLVGEIYQELRQTEAEFDELRHEDEENLLFVSTDRIELEGVDLGEFEIQLQLPKLAKPQIHAAYRVVALDPHPAASNESVTHPHVSDQQLCPGDAAAAIQAALGGGRISDFFMLVRSVLLQYSPASPFVPLEKWYGTTCYDCGTVMESGEAFFCQSCEHECCGECSSYCSRCDETACLGCLDTCSLCGDSVCPPCIADCPDCHTQLCQTCLDEGLCPCNQEPEEIEDDQEENANEGRDRLVGSGPTRTEADAA